MAQAHRRSHVKRTMPVFKRSLFAKAAREGREPACAWCGAPLASEEATVDHVVALADGGAHQLDNVVLACGPCNAGRPTRAQARHNQSNQLRTKFGRLWAAVDKLLIDTTGHGLSPHRWRRLRDRVHATGRSFTVDAVADLLAGDGL